MENWENRGNRNDLREDQLEQLNCIYHPHREAKEKCQMCKKTLCLACVRVYKPLKFRATGFGVSSKKRVGNINVSVGAHKHQYATKMHLCPACYNTRTQKDSPMGYYYTILMGLFIGFFPFQAWNTNPIFASIFLITGISFVIIAIKYILILQKTKKKVATETRKFMKILHDYGNLEEYEAEENPLPNQNKPSAQKNHQHNTCLKCGLPLDLDGHFCPKCGNPT